MKTPPVLSGSEGAAIMRPASGRRPGATSPMPALRFRHHAYLAALLLVGGLVAAGCKTDGLTAAKFAPPAPPKELGLHAYGPSRYLEEGSRWVERTPSGSDYAILESRRVEIKAAKILKTAPGEIELDGGEPMPAWTKGPARYMFWKGRDVYVAASFLGDLVKVATLPQDVNWSGGFDWLDGRGLTTEGGVMLVVPGTAADLKDTRVTSMPLAGVVEGLAADAKRAVATNIFGRAMLTIDGGKTFRDVNEEVGQASGLEVRGQDLIVQTIPGREHFIGPDGKLSDSAVAPGPRRGARPPDLEDAWADFSSEDAIGMLGREAIPLGDGVNLVVGSDRIAKVDAETARVINATQLEDMSGADCRPVKLPDTVLLACRSDERAMVIDVTGVPRIERTFELDEATGRRDLDGFSIADGIGLGYLGPCAGTTPEPEEIDGVTGASQRNQSPQRSPVFCARASADHWIEHRLPAEDAEDAIGWMPRPGGDAVVLVGRAGRLVTEEDRVATIGGLHIVRVPRLEPPLSLPTYASRGAETATREMRAGPDGSIEAWITNNGNGSGTAAIVIDAKGKITARPSPPRVESIERSGPFAMAHSDDGRLFETIDWGKRWIEVKGPPASLPTTRPSACTAVGCEIGGYVRVGWDSVDPKIPGVTTDYETGRAAARILREKNEYRRPPPKPTSVRLACSFASPGEGARQADSYGYGFGFTPTGTGGRGYGGMQRLGFIGMYSLPWWNGPMPTGLDVDLAWVDPLDLDARIHRATVPLAKGGTTTQRPYEMRLAYVMDEDGRIDLLPTGRKDICMAPLLEDAGVVLKVGACVDDPAMGVRIKDRVLVGSVRYSGFTLLAIDMPRSADGTAAVGTAQRELRTLATSTSPRGFTFGIGVRAGLPVGVAVDGRGDALLGPIDPNDGYIGQAEPLAPLTALKVGTDAKCPAGEKLDAGEARVLLPFDAAIGLSKTALPGVWSTGTAGLAIVRWSKDAACLEAVEMSVRDDRYDQDGSGYEGNGVLRKLIARFGKAPSKRFVDAKDKNKKKAPAKKAVPTASASASASASAAAVANPLSSPFSSASLPAATPTASASASATATVAPIPVAPPLPKGAGEGTLLVIQNGSELRQKLFCTGTTP